MCFDESAAVVTRSLLNVFRHICQIFRYFPSCFPGSFSKIFCEMFSHLYSQIFCQLFSQMFLNRPADVFRHSKQQLAEGASASPCRSDSDIGDILYILCLMFSQDVPRCFSTGVQMFSNTGNSSWELGTCAEVIPIFAIPSLFTIYYVRCFPEMFPDVFPDVFRHIKQHLAGGNCAGVIPIFFPNVFPYVFPDVSQLACRCFPTQETAVGRGD